MKILFKTMALVALSVPVWAQSVQTLEATTPQNIPLSAGAVTNVFIPASTVTSVTVPDGANTFIAGGDNAWVCEDLRRCSNVFPVATTSTRGWIFNPSGRMLKGNLQASTSLIYVYARPQDIVSGSTNIGVFEWSKQ